MIYGGKQHQISVSWLLQNDDKNTSALVKDGTQIDLPWYHFL